MQIYDVCVCVYLSLIEALEAVIDGEHFVTLGNSDSDGRAHGRVHARRRSADVQHRHVEITLKRNRKNKIASMMNMKNFGLNIYISISQKRRDYYHIIKT